MTLIAPRAGCAALLVILLILAPPAQAEEGSSCEPDCGSGDPGGNETAENGTSSPDQQGMTVCRVTSLHDVSRPAVDPDGCIRRTVYKLVGLG